MLARIYALSRGKREPGLARMRRLLELLSHPEQALRVIHIAGTNGKGSTGQCIASMLRAGGYRVGVYTSPHLTSVHERYAIDHALIGDDEFCRLAERVLSLSETLREEGFGDPAIFEVLTSVAYLFFREHRPDFVVMETGLGGRMDMTNAAGTPLVSVITQIGLDHTAELGDTLAEIAAEKAGIIKAGVPVISSSPEDEVRRVIAAAAEAADAPLIDASLLRGNVREIGEKTVFDAETARGVLHGLVLELPGRHQVRNAIAAIAAVDSLCQRGLAEVDEPALRAGLAAARNPGRFEVLRRDPYVILDGAHNPQGVKAALSALEDGFGGALDEKRIRIVFGCFRDKRYEEMADLLAEFAGRHDLKAVLAVEPVGGRALPAAELTALLAERGVAAEACADEAEAYARAQRGGCDITLFMGSLYLIGDIRNFFQEKGWKDYV